MRNTTGEAHPTFEHITFKLIFEKKARDVAIFLISCDLGNTPGCDSLMIEHSLYAQLALDIGLLLALEIKRGPVMISAVLDKYF